MKQKIIACVLAVAVFGLVMWLGIGPSSSGSAVADLMAELESIHGPEYTEKEVENGTEDMTFVVEPQTWFLTNWNLREMLGLDYAYECKVIFTTHTGEGRTLVRTITYQATDPMGKDATTARAHLDLDSKTETTEQK